MLVFIMLVLCRLLNIHNSNVCEVWFVMYILVTATYNVGESRQNEVISNLWLIRFMRLGGKFEWNVVYQARKRGSASERARAAHPHQGITVGKTPSGAAEQYFRFRQLKQNQDVIEK